MPPLSVKEQVRRLADELPDDADWDHVQIVVAKRIEEEQEEEFNWDEHPPCPPLTGEAWMEEIRRRSAEMDQGVGIPWEEVQRRIREKFGLELPRHE